MNRKLAIRNVMRLAKDYLVYFLTMTFAVSYTHLTLPTT